MTTPAPSTIESTPYFFNHVELARLAVYRAAVMARFYTDQCDAVANFVAPDGAGLLESVGEGC